MRRKCGAGLRNALVTPAGILAGSHPLFARALASIGGGHVRRPGRSGDAVVLIEITVEASER